MVAVANMKEIKVVSDEEAEECEYAVCASWATCAEYSDDNIKTNCCKCGAEIGHRPYAPTKPPKICLICFKEVMETLDGQR